MKFTAQQVIDALREADGIQKDAARILGCCRQTIAAYIERYSTVATVYDELNESFIDEAVGQYRELVRSGYWPAIRFALERQGKDRGFAERIEQEQINSVEVVIDWGEEDTTQQ